MPDPTTAGDDPAPPLASTGRQQRASVMLMASIEQSGGGTATKHRIRDLSSGGIRIDNAAGLRSGELVLVTVGALEAVEATIVWVRADLAGLSFGEQVDPQDARKKPRVTSVAPKATADALFPPLPAVKNIDKVFSPPTAGWLGCMRDPYRAKK
jgi:hypothetical protein